VSTHYAASKFMATFYEEEGVAYDNYCPVEMESRQLRVREICSLYLQTELAEKEPTDEADKKVHFR
jgi:hypothetical protein